MSFSNRHPVWVPIVHWRFLFIIHTIIRWELWASARRLLLIGVLIIIRQGSVLQFIIAIFVCVSGITMQSTFSPFNRLDENLLSLIAEWMVFFVVQMASSPYELTNNRVLLSGEPAILTYLPLLLFLLLL